MHSSSTNATFTAVEAAGALIELLRPGKFSVVESGVFAQTRFFLVELLLAQT